MIPEDYREFFVAAAGASGALIGLLFVAVSVFPEQARQATTRVGFNSRASAALLVFTNALVISLAALVPGVSLGWWAVVAGVTVLTFAAGTARSVAGPARRRGHRAESLWLIAGLTIIGGWEVYAGVRLIAGLDLGAVQALNYVVIGDLAYGIARAWQLIGLRDTGVVSSLRLIAGRDPDATGLQD
ncbi:hypothetical protein H7K45_18290 [Mycobacterium yunnanensis]|uniref:Uncharacterized protein n=1 Tax=Mycobacterium yunnanensis TaxID=368477 RepID=A0A9X2Z2A8_9MYCO|nr:hypothetical protein [Mycobacterium yunnanensis]MCV7422500.1 hypothetical protein [Mycobacterium yunnanensis]